MLGYKSSSNTYPINESLKQTDIYDTWNLDLKIKCIYNTE